MVSNVAAKRAGVIESVTMVAIEVQQMPFTTGRVHLSVFVSNINLGVCNEVLCLYVQMFLFSWLRSRITFDFYPFIMQ